MMKKKTIRIIIVALFCFSFVIAEARADRDWEFNEQRASRQTMFNSLTDFFATFCKSKQDSEAIRAQRRAQRKAKRLAEANRKRQAIIDRQIQQLNKQISDIMKQCPYQYRPATGEEQY